MQQHVIPMNQELVRELGNMRCGAWYRSALFLPIHASFTFINRAVVVTGSIKHGISVGRAYNRGKKQSCSNTTTYTKICRYCIELVQMEE